MEKLRRAALETVRRCGLLDRTYTGAPGRFDLKRACQLAVASISTRCCFGYCRLPRSGESVRPCVDRFSDNINNSC